MASQRYLNVGNHYTIPEGDEDVWSAISSQFPLPSNGFENHQNFQSPQQQHQHQEQETEAKWNFGEIDKFLVRHQVTERALPHAPWNQDATVSLPSNRRGQARSQYGQSVAQTDPYLVRESGRASVVTTDSGYHSLVHTTGPMDYTYTPHQLSRANLQSPVELDQGEYQYQPQDVPRSVVSAPVVQRRQARLPNKAHSRPKPRIPPCPDCYKEFSNNSDAAKHKLQHEKPFMCEEIPCTRVNGFATRNDLERHRKTVHGKVPRVGKKDGFFCVACPLPEPGIDRKLWGRRDNFKAHIKRRHADGSEEIILQRSRVDNPNAETTSSGQEFAVTATHTEPLNVTGQSIDYSALDREHSNILQQGDYVYTSGNGLQKEGLAGGGSGALADIGRNSARADIYAPVWRNGQYEQFTYPYGKAKRMSSMGPSMQEPRYGQPPMLRVTEVGDNNALKQNSADSQSNGYLSIPNLGSRGSNCSSSSSSDQGDGEYHCPFCSKRKHRECDLTKHMKRHTRPYGCTYPDCWKRFGSRNDWKRHENSQHHQQEQQEMWRCTLPRPDERTCGKLCYKVDDMRKHLKSPEHFKIFDGITISDARLESMHIGPNSYIHFWCGFCNQLISSKGELPAWRVRSQHIGDHYDKEDRDINNWVCIKGNRAKKCLDARRVKTLSAAQKTRSIVDKRRVDWDEEEDSDLGEDGIPRM